MKNNVPEKKKKVLKVVLNALLIAVLLGLTAYLVLSKQELPQIAHYIAQANPLWLLAGIVLLLIFVSCESVIFHHLFRRLRSKVPFRRCLVYSYVGFFFSAVTPSASGGQPVQLVWMQRDKVDFGISSLILLVVTLGYKLALMALSVVLLLCNWGFVMEHIGFMLYIFIFGFLLNLAFCIFLAIVIFRPIPASRAANGILAFLCKIRLVRNRDSAQERLDSALGKYSRGAHLLLGHKGLLWEVFGVSVIQRVSFFAITYMVYLSFGLSGSNFFEIIALQSVLSLALDILPFPGGIGANEGGFLEMYKTIFGSSLVVSGMLLSRGINYYLLVLVGAAVTILSYAIQWRRASKLKK